MSKNSIIPFLKDYLINFLTSPFLLDTNDTFHIIRVMSILNSSRLCNRIEFQVYSFFSTYSQPFCPESSVLLVSVILIIPFFFSLAVEVFLYFTYKSDYIYCSCWRAGFFPFQQVDPYEVILIMPKYLFFGDRHQKMPQK